jgi:hypothetical protein
MRRRTKVISGLAVAGAAAGLGTLVAVKVRHNRAEVTFEDGHHAVATVARSGDLNVICACGKPNCEHVQAAAVVAAAKVPRHGNALWHALRGSLDDLLRRPSKEQAETTANVAQHVLETEGFAVKAAEPTAA